MEKKGKERKGMEKKGRKGLRGEEERNFLS